MRGTKDEAVTEKQSNFPGQESLSALTPRRSRIRFALQEGLFGGRRAVGRKDE